MTVTVVIVRAEPTCQSTRDNRKNHEPRPTIAQVLDFQGAVGRRPEPGGVRTGSGPEKRDAAETGAVPVVGDGDGPTGHGRGGGRRRVDRRRRSRGPRDHQAQAVRGTVARNRQVGPAVLQRDLRVPARGAVPAGTLAGRRARADVADVRVRPQRQRRQLARGHDRAPRSLASRRRRLLVGPLRPGSAVPRLRALGLGHRRARPVPRHVVHGQTEEPGGVSQAGRPPARDPVGRRRVAGQGQRAQVVGHAWRSAADGPGSVQRRQAQRVPVHDPRGGPQPQAGHDTQGTICRHMPR